VYIQSKTKNNAMKIHNDSSSNSKQDKKLPDVLVEYVQKVVLSELEMFRKNVISSRLKKLERIVSRGKGARIDGVVVDPATAENILDYYHNYLGDNTKNRFMRWPIRKMMFGANNASMDLMEGGF